MLIRKICSLAAAVLLLTGLSIRLASDSPRQRETLKGLKGIAVLVEDLTPDAERDGITKSQLQTDVELRLRQSGILVTQTASEYLYVNVNALKSRETTGYVYSVQLDFMQPVAILRTGQRASAGTWDVGTVGLVPVARASQVVRETVRDRVDEFINAYLSVNPKP